MNEDEQLALSHEITQLRRELQGTQEMLGFVLLQVGEPIYVTKETLTRGIPNGAQISIEEDQQGERFVFSLKVPE